MNAIYIRRRKRLYIKEGVDHLPDSYLATLQKNIANLGFVLSKPLLERIRTLSLERLQTFYKSLIGDLRAIVGAHREFKPMYPNFPNQVMRMSNAQLYLNAIWHYFTNHLPEQEIEPRPELSEFASLRVLDLGSKEEFEKIFTQIAGARTSISPQDKLDVVWFVAQYRDRIVPLLPSKLTNKENLAFVGAQLVRYTSIAEDFLKDKIKTATDVLRLAVALSDGDVSLANPTKFTNFKRAERKQMLAWLESFRDPTEDMLRWKERWKRLGEKLHPREHQERFPKAAAAFAVLRNDTPYITFNSRVEGHLLRNETLEVMNLLEHRPGDLARRLDHLLRSSKEPNSVLSRFEEVADRVSTAVLLQVLAHFQHRNEPHPLRTMFPKGEVAKVYALENRLPKLAEEIAAKAANICETQLVRRFEKLPKLGKCWLDPDLTNFLVPFSQRSASKALRTIVRGSRLPFPKCNVLRFFLWWKNGRARTDIDLSAVLYDQDFKYVDVLSYYNLKNFGGHHSGDIVDAPNGAAEFIDLDLNLTLAQNIRYVVMSINSFTNQPYCDLPECFAGWMARQQAASGEIFEPRTVQDKFDIASDTRICIPAFFDIVDREVIWTDIALKNHPSWNNVQNNLSGVSLMLRAMNNPVKPTLHTLFSLHIRARGEPTAHREVADSVFSIQEGITPFDGDRIVSEFL